MPVSGTEPPRKMRGLGAAALFVAEAKRGDVLRGRVGDMHRGHALRDALLERRASRREARFQSIARGVGRVIAFALEHVFGAIVIARQSR